jgi:hypothetical protein
MPVVHRHAHDAHDQELPNKPDLEVALVYG